jgi:hypothetical protein
LAGGQISTGGSAEGVGTVGTGPEGIPEGGQISTGGNAGGGVSSIPGVGFGVGTKIPCPVGRMVSTPRGGGVGTAGRPTGTGGGIGIDKLP